MAQVAYHVQLTWLLMTAVTPDRPESTRLDSETVVLYVLRHYNGNRHHTQHRLSAGGSGREHGMHVIDDSIPYIITTNEGAIVLEQKTVQWMPGDCID